MNESTDTSKSDTTDRLGVSRPQSSSPPQRRGLAYSPIADGVLWIGRIAALFASVGFLFRGAVSATEVEFGDVLLSTVGFFLCLAVAVMFVRVQGLTHFVVCFSAVLVGCSQPDLPKPMSSPSDQTETANAPSIKALEQDAAVLRKLLGYPDVVAYEFQGTWLECWLECELDGEVVACTPQAAVIPKTFGASAKIDFVESENVTGWITVWGDDQERLQLKMRAELPRSDGKTYCPHNFTWELQIPQLESGPNQRRYRSGSGLEVGWVKPLELPSRSDRPMILRSYQWTEGLLPDGEVMRETRVTLYCQCTSDES